MKQFKGEIYMKVKGTISTEFDVEAFDVITNLCQIIGVVDENGNLVAKQENNRIIKHWFDEWNDKHTEVLYNQPFDIKYASTLIKLYELSSNYLMLSGYIENRTDGRTEDYQTVGKLKIRKKLEETNF